jgi:putative membrane protein
MMSRLTGLMFGFTAALAPVMAWANGGKEGYSGHGYMWGGGMGHWLWGPLMMIVVIAAIVLIVVLVVRWIGGAAAGGGIHGPTIKSPVDILKERYARGEMTTEEFEERCKALGE